MGTAPALLPAVPLILLATAGAGWDIARRRIPNWLCLLTLLAGIGFTVAGDLSHLVSHFGHFALALAIGVALFALRWVGGGDAKFYAALAIWFPFGDAWLFAAGIGLGGLVVCGVFIGLRLVGLIPQRSLRAIPYGAAIAFGATVTALV